ncbi:MAG: M20/M25/M40 family metallo-hydrolase [Candidatus Marinimicrobia bacterium]|nr:M20/M25/M40 family metallo-hydrolase [Candidatus Neomarinimicrobiota bacterium]
MAIISNTIYGADPAINDLRAYKDLLTQCNFGPRYSGTEGYEKMKEWLSKEAQSYSDTIIFQNFTERNPFTKNKMPHTNIIARLNPHKTPRLLLSAHYDTRPVADMDPDILKREEAILGANDGASGVAVLLEIMRVLKESGKKPAVDFIFWDAEDMGRSGRSYEFCLGSRYYANNIITPRPVEGILLDMIGDSELKIYYEDYSMHYHPGLMVDLWNIAADRGYGDIFIPKIKTAVYDDHVPLNQIANIPSVDIIDFNYPNEMENYWHTHEDKPENCSAESLGIIADVVLNYILKKY